jgi:hypothetical protein
MSTRAASDKLTEVRVLNSEINTHYFMNLREDRLRDFYKFMMENRRTVSFGHLPGYSAATVLGITTIFSYVPSKFPVVDVITWLRDEQKNYLGGYPNPTVTSDEICTALASFAEVRTQIDGQGNEV